MADITIDQLQDVLGRTITDLSDKLESQQKTQATSIAKVLKDVVGEDRTSIRQYESILSDKFNAIVTYIKDITKEFSKNTTAEQPVNTKKQSEQEEKQTTENKTNTLNSIKPVNLSTAITTSTKAVPVRVLEALNLKKAKEIDFKRKSEVNIDIPPETRVWLENLLFDNFKDFTDELFERRGGLHDLYNVTSDIDKLLKSGNFGSDKKKDDDWLSKLLKDLGLLALPGLIGAALAALTGLAALVGGTFAPGGFGKGRLGKALTKKAKPNVEEEEINEKEKVKEKAKSKTETEKTLKKTKEKIAQREKELAERNLEIDEKLNQLNEDLLAKRTEAANADRTANEMYKKHRAAEEAYEQASEEAAKAKSEAEASGLEEDIKTSDTLNKISEARLKDATNANIEYQKANSEYVETIRERGEIEQKITELKNEQLNLTKEETAKIKNLKEGKSTEPLGDKTKATLPEKAAKAADAGKATEVTTKVTGDAAKTAEAVADAAENAAKAAEAVAKVSKIAKVGGTVAVVAGAGLEAYEGSKEFKQIDADLKAKKITEEEARKKKEDVVGGRTGKFAAETGGAIAGGIAAGEVGAALGLLTGPAAVVASPLLALGFGIAGSIAGEKAVKALKLDEMASKVGKKVSEGVGELVHKSNESKKEQSLSANDAPKQTTPDSSTPQTSPIAPAETAASTLPVTTAEPPDQYKQIFTNPPIDTTTADGFNSMSGSLDEHSKLLKGLIEYQKQTATNTKDLMQAFMKSQGTGNNVNVNNISSSTNINASPVTSSMFRQAVIQR